MAKKSRKRRRGRGFVKTIFNPRQWMSYDSVRDSGEKVGDMVKDLTNISKSTRVETFEESIKRQNLSEEDIKARMKTLLISSSAYCGIGAVLLIYSLFSLFAGSLLPFLVTVVLSLLAFALSFRDSFFYFQMKKRKLGCSIKEWIAFITRRG